jgi:hypothetical protein
MRFIKNVFINPEYGLGMMTLDGKLCEAGNELMELMHPILGIFLQLVLDFTKRCFSAPKFHIK